MAQTQDSTQAEPPSIPTHTLNDGNALPAIGFGTHPLKGEEGITAMVHAIEVGYRLLDTAVNYENETEVGEAIRRSGLPRNEVQVTSKLFRPTIIRLDWFAIEAQDLGKVSIAAERIGRIGG